MGYNMIPAVRYVKRGLIILLKIRLLVVWQYFNERRGYEIYTKGLTFFIHDVSLPRNPGRQ